MDRLRRLMIAATFICAALPAAAQEAFSVGTNWLPDAERGGFYHAQAAGIYRKYGLDVTVQAGGPQLNNPQLLAAGRMDAVMVTSAVEAFNYAKNDVPIVAVAAIYQRNPQILISHKAYGLRSFEDMKGKPIMISSLARNGYWLWLKAKYGFSDDQIRPYTFNLVNFLNNPQAIQQGFATYEPYAVGKQGAEADVFLLADAGYNDYGGILLVRRETLEKRRDTVQRFVRALSEGWRDFLFGDSAPGLALIKSQNAQLTDDLIANSMKVMVERGLIHSGDAAKDGIGAMSQARWQAIFDEMSTAGVVEKGEYWRKAFDLSLVQSGLAKAP
ncbi:MAG: ABC transporter substrate-binding protein [Telmatospirillum sp.]|nr:ABC transporter substrate-binding protein [Telmatospirillum sp.]